MIYFNRFRDFEDGAIIEALGYDIVLRRRSLGELILPTGHLVACDPFSAIETEAFSQVVAPGSYPLSLIVAQLRDEMRVAYAVLRLSEQEAVRWEVATLPHETLDIFDRADCLGYPVDSAVGCFMDIETANAVLSYTQVVRPEDNDYERLLRAKLSKRRKQGYGWAVLDLRRDLKLPAGEGANLLAFDSGYGTGIYTTYIGRDSNDEIVRIVTDFQVLELTFNTFAWRK